MTFQSIYDNSLVDLRSGLPVVGGIVFELARQAAITTARGDLADTRFRLNAELGQMRSVQERATPASLDAGDFAYGLQLCEWPARRWPGVVKLSDMLIQIQRSRVWSCWRAYR